MKELKHAPQGRDDFGRKKDQMFRGLAGNFTLFLYVNSSKNNFQKCCKDNCVDHTKYQLVEAKETGMERDTLILNASISNLTFLAFVKSLLFSFDFD